MTQFDYIIVGQGLAGTILCFRLRQLGKSVCVIDKFREVTSSKVALGAYNPMVLKRFTPCWKVEEQLEPLYAFINEFEYHYNTQIHQPLKLWRKFQSVQEQNLWLEKSEKKRLTPFMNPVFIKNPHHELNADFGFGEVNYSGRVVLSKMISILRDDLLSTSSILDEDFDFKSLVVQKDKIEYKSVNAAKIVFCEGHRLSDNPFFNYLPLMRTKGELITVKLKGLKVSEHIKSNISILPLGDDVYKVGATFNWDDKDEDCSEEGKRDLLDKLQALVNIKPQIIKQEAGLRPTVKDRRALLGAHPKHNNVYVFNGLGTRGLLISPFLCLQLVDFMEDKLSLDIEVDVKRYEKEFQC